MYESCVTELHILVVMLTWDAEDRLFLTLNKPYDTFLVSKFQKNIYLNEAYNEAQQVSLTG